MYAISPHSPGVGNQLHDVIATIMEKIIEIMITIAASLSNVSIRIFDAQLINTDGIVLLLLIPRIFFALT